MDYIYARLSNGYDVIFREKEGKLWFPETHITREHLVHWGDLELK